MEKKNNNTLLIRMLSASLLISLLILAPCKVRNAIESTFDLEQTEVLNKSVTTLSSSCIASVETQLIQNVTSTEPISTFAKGIVHSEERIEVSKTSEENNNYSLVEINSFQATPLYILYQSLKVYL